MIIKRGVRQQTADKARRTVNGIKPVQDEVKEKEKQLKGHINRKQRRD